MHDSSGKWVAGGWIPRASADVHDVSVLVDSLKDRKAAARSSTICVSVKDYRIDMSNRSHTDQCKQSCPAAARNSRATRKYRSVSTVYGGSNEILEKKGIEDSLRLHEHVCALSCRARVQLSLSLSLYELVLVCNFWVRRLGGLETPGETSKLTNSWLK
ncbi:hypothetical protein WAI453_009044 [Rhynchosporium graminicola]